MEGVIKHLHTLEELNEWAVIWGMEDDDLIQQRRVEILQELTDTNTPVLPENLL